MLTRWWIAIGSPSFLPSAMTGLPFQPPLCIQLCFRVPRLRQLRTPATLTFQSIIMHNSAPYGAGGGRCNKVRVFLITLHGDVVFVGG